MREAKTRLCSSLAVVLVLIAASLTAGPGLASADFSVASFSSEVSTPQAGAHADFSSSFALGTEALGNPNGQLRNATIALPAGLVGNPQTIERCPAEILAKLDCKGSSQVGEMSLTVVECRGVSPPLAATAEAGSTRLTVPDAKAFCTEETGNVVTIGTGASAETARVVSIVNATTLELAAPLEYSHSAGETVTHIANTETASLPLFNIQPTPGHVATFAASLLLVDILIQVNVGEDGGLTATISDASTLLPIQASAVTLWGVPGAASHNSLRCNELNYECGPSKTEPAPFMTNPTTCAGPLSVGLSLTSWQGKSASRVGTLPTLTGCEKLTMTPSLAVAATSTRRDSLAGYEVDLQQPQAEGPYELATPDLEKVAIALPPGTSLSPGLANGLQACEQAQFAEANCPGASVMGNAEVSSPLLPQPLKGEVYIGVPTPTERYRLFVRVKAGDTAIALHGEVQANEETGQVTAVFENAPEIPFSALKVNFFGGPGAALANPPTCGPATSTASITSYAGQVANPSSTFEINEDSGGGPCPTVSPFAPSLTAGSLDAVAGQSSRFVLSLARSDGEQSLSSFMVHLPAGLMGLVGNVPHCPESQAAIGTCSPASQIGMAKVAAGPGPLPLDLSGPVYLTGPYDGAPFGLEIAIPGVAGPFNFGIILVRSRVFVSPSSLAMTIASDALPQSVAGVPLRLRAIQVELSRPGFILNPTSCGDAATTASIQSVQGATSEASVPFHMTGCQDLGFAPHVTGSTQAKASRAGNGAGLDVDIRDPHAIGGTLRTALIQMPGQLRPRLSTIRRACLLTASTALTSCSTDSIVGEATVSSPVVGSSLSGAVYLVSHGGLAPPGLSMRLSGEGLEVDLEGKINISSADAISVMFANLPDVPISSLSLVLPAGRNSLLGTISSLCAKPVGLAYTLADHAIGVAKGRAAISVSGCPRRQSKPAARRSNRSGPQGGGGSTRARR